MHDPRGPKGTRGSIRHQAHITEHIGLIHIGKEMVHSIEREREGRCAVASDLYMLGGKYYFVYIYLLYSLTISALTCYHKGAALLRHTPSILGWPQGYHWIVELVAVAALVAHPLDFSAVAY